MAPYLVRKVLLAVIEDGGPNPRPPTFPTDPSEKAKFLATARTLATKIETSPEFGQMWVRDPGQWRAPSARGGGWGLELMRALTDTVDVDRTADGTVVHLQRWVGLASGAHL